MSYMAQRVGDSGPSIFLEMSILADQYNAISLVQGYPDFPVPDFIKRPAIQAIENDANQYAPGKGLLSLRQAIAQKMARHYGLPIDPDSEIIITTGATGAVFAAIMGLVDPGDEVILFEPFYSIYLPAVRMAGGVPRFYVLRPPYWSIDRDELAALFSDKTKLVLINSPHNPTGKVFAENELRLLADLCHKHDVIAVTDEVYEHILFDGYRHVPMATYPGMSRRTVTISSLGKSYGVTGWKVGWAIAAPELTQALFRVHQAAAGSVVAPLQAAAAEIVQASNRYYAQMVAMYQENRDFLQAALWQIGLKPITPHGTFFVTADLDKLDFPDSVAFCRYLAREGGVAAVPVSGLCHEAENGARLVRFTFAKSRPLLEEVARRLAAMK